MGWEWMNLMYFFLMCIKQTKYETPGNTDYKSQATNQEDGLFKTESDRRDCKSYKWNCNQNPAFYTLSLYKIYFLNWKYTPALGLMIGKNPPP